MCTVGSCCQYHTTLMLIKTDRVCISLRPHTNVLWCQCQVSDLVYCIQQCRCPNPLSSSYLFRRIKTTMSSQSAVVTVSQNQKLEKKLNKLCQVSQLLFSSRVMSPEKIQLRYGDTVDDLFSSVQVKLFQFRCYEVRDVRYRRSWPTISPSGLLSRPVQRCTTDVHPAQ